MTSSLRLSLVASVGWLGLLAPAPAFAAGVTAASYFGGTGEDQLTGAAIGADGSIFVSGNSSSAALAGAAGTTLAPGGGFVAKLDRSGTQVTWLTRIAAAGELKLTAEGEPIVETGSHLTKLSADGSAIAWTGADVGASVSAFDIGPHGDLALIAGNTVYLFAADGVTQKFKAATGRSNAVAVAIDPVSGDVFASGDQNAGYGTCGGPWRSPFIFRYDASGNKIAKLYDYSGQEACDQSLAADSFFTRLRFESDGEFWVSGGADGGNTVLTRAAADLTKPNAALAGACFSSPCYGWKGAGAPRFFARMNSDFSDFQRATFIVAHFNLQPVGCSCDVLEDDGAGARPNSAGLDFVFRTSTGDVVGAGTSAWHFPVVNAWYPAAGYAGYTAVVSILDSNLGAMKLATMLPGAGSTSAAAYRGGRLVVVGAAADNSAWVPPAGQEAQAQVVLPATPEAAPLQAKFGGGMKDGFIYVACVTNDAECGAAPIPDPGLGGASAVGGGPASAAGGAASTSGGASGAAGALGGASSSAGAVSGSGGSVTPAGDSGGCGCRLSPWQRSDGAAFAALIVGWALHQRRRRVARLRQS